MIAWRHTFISGIDELVWSVEGLAARQLISKVWFSASCQEGKLFRVTVLANSDGVCRHQRSFKFPWCQDVCDVRCKIEEFHRASWCASWLSEASANAAKRGHQCNHIGALFVWSRLRQSPANTRQNHLSSYMDAIRKYLIEQLSSIPPPDDLAQCKSCWQYQLQTDEQTGGTGT